MTRMTDRDVRTNAGRAGEARLIFGGRSPSATIEKSREEKSKMKCMDNAKKEMSGPNEI